jgi:acetyl esterase/lipase
MDQVNELQYAQLLAQYDETVINVPGQSSLGGGFGSSDAPAVEVVLLRPKGAPPDERLPLVVWMHGGGMVLGSHRDGYAGPLLAGLQQRGVRVAWASVRYRLAPDHAWPAAPDDCFRALEHLLLEPERLRANPRGSGAQQPGTVPGRDAWRAGVDAAGGAHLAGVSAGGNLAIATALRALAARLPVRSLFIDEPMLRLEDIPRAERQATGDTERDKEVAEEVAEGEVAEESKEGGDEDEEISAAVATSWQRNAYTRTAPVVWLDWCWRAYLRGHCDPGLVGEAATFVSGRGDQVSGGLARGAPRGTARDVAVGTALGSSPHGSCAHDSVAGGMGAAAWRAAFAPQADFAIAHASLLRTVVVVTARGCPMRDAGVAFADALKLAAAEAAGHHADHGRPLVTHVDARGSHALPLVVDPEAAAAALDAWGRGFL